MPLPTVPSPLNDSIFLVPAIADEVAGPNPDAEIWEIRVSRWEISPNVRLADTTVTGIGNGTLKVPVRKDPRGYFEMPMNSAAYLEAVAGGTLVYAGAVIRKAWFVHSPGVVTKGDMLEYFTLQDFQKIMDANGDVVRIRVPFEGGFHTANTTVTKTSAAGYTAGNVV